MSLNIIETIELIRKNKKCFVNQEDYLKILTNLYNELSNKNTTPEINFDFDLSDNEFNIKDYNLMLDKICSIENIKEILEIKNIKWLSNKNPLLNIFLFENNSIKLNLDEIKINVQQEPQINNYDKEQLVKEIKTYLHICDIAPGYKNKAIIVILIFNIIFSNFQFVIDHNKFALTVKAKLTELKKDTDKLYEICDKYNLDKKFFNSWCETFDNL